MPLSKYLPLENYVLTTNLSAEQVYQRLSDKVEPRSSAMFSFSKQSSSKPYEGEVSIQAFSINRIIEYRNSFIPIIKGHVTAYPEKTEIRIEMRLTKPILIFMTFWLGGVGLICLVALGYFLVNIQNISTPGISPVVFIPFGMFIFGYGMIILGFKSESKESRIFLSMLLNEQENP